MFFEEFIEFKNKLQQQNSTNLKYLICRLDFNEFYQIKEELNKRNFGGGDDEDMDLSYGSQDDGEEDEDDDDEDDDDEDDDDEDDDGENDSDEDDADIPE